MPQLFALTNLRTNKARLLSAEALVRFFENRDPRDWTDPVPVSATEWVA